MHSSDLADDEPMATMNFIPLIDIALTLVIILMVTTAFIRAPGVRLNLPQTATREGAPETPKDLIVAVTADGSLYVDAQKCDVPALQGRLAAAAARNKEARILIKGDRDVAHGRVMEVLDYVRQAGLTRVVFPTDPRVLPQSASPGPVPAPLPAVPPTGEGLLSGNGPAGGNAPAATSPSIAPPSTPSPGNAPAG